MDQQSIHERFAAAKTFLGEGRRILISGHRSPDGDSLGSMIALARMLRAAGHDAVATADVRALGKPVPWVCDGTGNTTAEQDLELAESLSRTAGVPVPEAIASLRGATVRHTTVCEVSEMEEQVRAFLK